MPLDQPELRPELTPLAQTKKSSIQTSDANGQATSPGTKNNPVINFVKQYKYHLIILCVTWLVTLFVLLWITKPEETRPSSQLNTNSNLTNQDKPTNNDELPNQPNETLVQTSPTPKPAPTHVPSPVPTPTSENISSNQDNQTNTAQPNLYFASQTPRIFQRPIQAKQYDLNPNYISNSSEIIGVSNKKIVYSYQQISQQITDTTFNLGDKLSIQLEIQNSETVSSSPTQVWVETTINNNQPTTKMYDLNSLNKGDDQDFFHELLLTVSGEVKIRVLIDPENLVTETTESDNQRSYTFNVKPDETAPYIEAHRDILQELPTEICIYPYAISANTTDNQDPAYYGEPNDLPLVRWRARSNNPTNTIYDYSNWNTVKQLTDTYPDKHCFNKNIGTTYTLEIVAQDSYGNLSTLTKSITAQ